MLCKEIFTIILYVYKKMQIKMLCKRNKDILEDIKWKQHLLNPLLHQNIMQHGAEKKM
jgi:hypothetical protein